MMSKVDEKKTSVARAMTISGTMMLMKVKAWNGPLNQRGARCSPSAAIVPKMVAMTAVEDATMRLFANALWTAVSLSTLSYHLRLKPSHWVTRRSVPLKLEARKSAGFSEDELMKKLTSDARPFGQCLAALGLSWKHRVEAGTPIDLPVLDFGTAALMLLPAESYVEYQLAAQKMRPEAFVLVAGYGECGPGYIPIERAWEENDANLSDWCWVEKGSEKRMLDAIEKALKPA